MTADIREVLLATIRGRLLDDDAHIVRLEYDVVDRHYQSIAEHAMDAALARGVALGDVYREATAELARILDFETDDCGLFEPSIDHLGDVAFEQLAGDETPSLLRGGLTVNGLRRAQTLRVLNMLVNRIELRAARRVHTALLARTRERGLSPDTTFVGDVLDEGERLEIYTAGLYGDGEELSARPPDRDLDQRSPGNRQEGAK